MNQSFDVMSNRTELKATIGSTLDFKNTYQYDTLQRLTDIVQQGQSGGNAVTAKHLTFAYNALSQRTEIARYQSTGTSNAVATTDYTFNSANRLSGIAHEQGATALNTYAYTYDTLSRIATIISTAEGTDTYSYDQTSQLVGATHTSHSNETYGFDANGNRNTTGFTTGDNNQTTAGLGFTYTYDDEGNRTSKTETSTGKVEEYTWDHRNRLTKVVFRNSSGGSIVKQVDYEYDPYNRMVRRTYDADGAGAGAATNQYWVYDEGINAVLEFDGSSGSDLAHRYLWSNSVDELLADEIVTSLGSGGNVLWALADHLGSIRDIADLNESTGVTSVANHRTWNSFGELIAETNAAVDMLFAFTGKQFDEATGLQHNLFRWLDPELGQWLNEDLIGFAAGDDNVRRYVGNAVVQSIDATGLADSDPSKVHLLITGFGHFADLPPGVTNPSSVIANQVGQHLTQLGIPNTVLANLPVDWSTLETDIYGKIENLREMQPDATIVWIALGAGGGWYVENTADNLRARIPDLFGNTPGVKNIPLYNLPGGQETYINDHAPDLLQQLRAAPLPFNLSSEAGGFLCENAAYLIEVYKKSGQIGQGAFLHVRVNWNPNRNVPSRMLPERLARVLADFYGPNGDPDGDGIPTNSDPQPFVPNPS